MASPPPSLSCASGAFHPSILGEWEWPRADRVGVAHEIGRRIARSAAPDETAAPKMPVVFLPENSETELVH